MSCTGRFFVILFVGFALLLNGCSEKNKNRTSTATIFGAIGETVIDSLVIQYDKDSVLNIEIVDNNFAQDFGVSEKGSYLKLIHGETSSDLFALPGDKITVEFPSPDSLSFSGDRSRENNFLQTKNASLINLYTMTDYSVDETTFLNRLDSALQVNFEEIETTLDGDKIDPGFIDYQKQIERFKMGHLLTMFANVQWTKGSEVSDNFFDAVDEFDMDNEDYWSISANKNFQYFYYDHLPPADLSEDEHTLAVIDSIASRSKNETIRNFLVYAKTNSNLPYTKDLELLYQKFNVLCTDEEYKTKIKALYDDLSRLQPGKPTPGFTDFTDQNGELHSLPDYRGQYVYIMVWGTWCPFCKMEMPFAQELAKKYSGQGELEVLFVALNKDKKKWQIYLDENDLKGIHLIMTEEQEEAFSQNYMVKGPPKFILIDPDGNFVSANAPDPSTPELNELFTRLNI